jgi:uncharacterized protein YdaT
MNSRNPTNPAAPGANREGARQGESAELDAASALERLEPDVRRRAIDRAAELMAQGHSGRHAMRVATAVAKEWANNGKPEESLAEPALHVLFESGSWRVCSEEGRIDELELESLEDAVGRARQLATDSEVPIYVHEADGGVREADERGEEGMAASAERGDPTARTHDAPTEPAAAPMTDREADAGAFHVVPYQERWALKRSGPDGLLTPFKTKREAVTRGRELARSAGSALVIHRQTGEVQRHHYYNH